MQRVPFDKTATANGSADGEMPAPGLAVQLALPAAAFALYWLSSFLLEARGATTHFGADTWYYEELAHGDVLSRIQGNFFLDRITRFHPATVLLADLWMKLASPLAAWLSPLQILKAMFAAIGALGVWAALRASAVVLPRREAVLFGGIYAVSFGVWYFSSIEESKIVTATLSSLYIAAYLHLRRHWSVGGVAMLAAILLAACLNEMASGLLIVIPIVDALVRRERIAHAARWIAVHALAAPMALLFIEGVLYGRVVALTNEEGSNHVDLLLSYVTHNEYDGKIYAFLANWLFFNIAAPSAEANWGLPPGVNYRGYFEPLLSNYLLAPASIALVVVAGVIAAACLLPHYRRPIPDAARGLVPALAAFMLLRGAFFFLFNPGEPLLFSPAVTLAQVLVIAIAFSASTLPARQTLLAIAGLLLLVSNGLFIVGA